MSAQKKRSRRPRQIKAESEVKQKQTPRPYIRMLSGMQRKQKAAGRKRAEKWFLYMLKCADQSLYTGIAKDVEKRFKVHSSGKGARYTRTRLPLEIVYRETCQSRTDALVRELKVKKMTAKKKHGLVDAYRAGGTMLKKALRDSRIRTHKKQKGVEF